MRPDRPYQPTDEDPYPRGPVNYRQATPNDVEQRLYQLTRELDAITLEIQQAEAGYLTAKTDFEVAYARAYIAAHGSNMKQREAEALIATADLKKQVVLAEALVRAHKENARRIYAHVDIARSVSVIVRAAIGAS